MSYGSVAGGTSSSAPSLRRSLHEEDHHDNEDDSRQHDQPSLAHENKSWLPGKLSQTKVTTISAFHTGHGICEQKGRQAAPHRPHLLPIGNNPLNCTTALWTRDLHRLPSSSSQTPGELIPGLTMGFPQRGGWEDYGGGYPQGVAAFTVVPQTFRVTSRHLTNDLGVFELSQPVFDLLPDVG